MKKITLLRVTIILFLLIVKNFTTNAQVLDQSQVGETNGCYTSGSSLLGQSFTAGISGLLTAIEVKSAGVITPGTVTLKIFNGAGFSGTLLNTQTVSIVDGVINNFVISNPINVVSGNTYTFQLVSTGFHFFNMAALNYGGGAIYFPTINDYPNYDMWFKTYVTVTNVAPTDIALSASSINENVPSNTVVGALTSTDSDSGNTFSYSLVSGIGSTDNSSFTISGINLQINTSPDFEIKSSYSIRVRTTDQGGLFYEKQFTITINDLCDTTTQPTAIATQVYAGLATLADLTVTGTNIKWYDAATSVTILPTTTSLVDGTTYYASQTVAGCESPTRVAVTVRKISEATQSLCSPATVANLIATPSSGFTANWFTSATGGALLSGSTTLTSGMYYVEQSNASSSNVGSGFSFPYGVAIDANGNIYVADSINNVIKKMDANGNNIVTLGSGFNRPFGIALDTAGNIYVADSQNNVIKKMDPTGTTITTIGTGFNNPFSLTVDAVGNVFVADNDNNLVKKINSTYTSITTLGSGFIKPLGIDVDTAGNIYVTDFGSNTIKKMDSNGNNIVTLATTTSLPRGVTVGPQGEIVFSQGNGQIRSMDANGNNQVVLGVQPEPTGLAFNPSGILHLASTSSSSIRKLTGTTSNRFPVTIVVNPSSNNTTTTSACDSYTWANTGQTYTTSGVYTGTTTNCVTEKLDLTINNATTSQSTAAACDTYTWAANGTTYTQSGTYTNTTTNAAGCPNVETLTLTINPSATISIQPQDQAIVSNQTATFTVTASGATSYQWQFFSTVSGVWNNLQDTLTNPDVTGSSTNTLSISGNGLFNISGFQFRVLIDTGNCVTTSDGANLTVTLGDVTFGKEIDLTIYPNPSTGIFNLKLPTDLQIEVYNNLGQLLSSEKMLFGTNVIDISDKASGVYFLKAIDGNNSNIFKVIKN